MKNFIMTLISHPISLIVVSIASIAIGERTSIMIQKKKADARVKKYGGSADINYHGITIQWNYKVKSN